MWYHGEERSRRMQNKVQELSQNSVNTTTTTIKRVCQVQKSPKFANSGKFCLILQTS